MVKGFWACPWLSVDRRLQFSRYGKLINERAKDGRQSIFQLQYMRMEPHV